MKPKKKCYIYLLGFNKIKEACARYDGPLSEYDINKSEVMVLCKACDRYQKLLKGDNHHNHSGHDVVMMKVPGCAKKFYGAFDNAQYVC